MDTETAAPDPALDAAAAPADAADAPDAADASDASDAPTADAPDAPDAPDAADAPADAPDAADASDASDAGGWVVAGGRGALVRASAAADSARVGVLPAETRCVAEDAAAGDGGKVRVRLSSPLAGWVSLKLLRCAAPPAAPARTVDSALVTLDWFGKDYSGRFASAKRNALPKKTKIYAVGFAQDYDAGVTAELGEDGWRAMTFPAPYLAPTNWRELPGRVGELVSLSDDHTTVLAGGADWEIAVHPAALVARAGPSGPAFGSYDDADGKRTPEQKRAADEKAFPSSCGSCGSSDVTRVLFAAICSQHSSYSMSHYQWVVEYEVHCLTCELAGRRPYTTRTNHTSHAMPAAQGYIAREAGVRGEAR